MSAQPLSAYLDTGSLNLFARQICEAVEGAQDVSIFDEEGRRVWSAPLAEDVPRARIPESLIRRALKTEEGMHTGLEGCRDLYTFVLREKSQGDCMGALCVLVRNTSSVPFEKLSNALRPILVCVERQLAINAELSAVRRMSSESQDDLGLILKLDEIVIAPSLRETLEPVIRLCVDHLQCQLGTVVLPQHGVQEIYAPGCRGLDEASRCSLMVSIGKLLGVAKIHRRVLLSNDRTGPMARLFNADRNILCSPIVDSRDEVIGILVLLSDERFSRRHIRIARAVCTKIGVLSHSMGHPASKQLSRHGLIHHIDGVIRRDPHTQHALLYIDLDKLHVVNDSFGYEAGDNAIRKVAGLLDDIVGAGEAVAHLAGDRFAVFLRDSDVNKAQGAAELILRSLGRVEHEGKVIELSASIGVSLIPTTAENGAQALSIAEVACRSAKDRGRGRAVVYEDLDASMLQRRNDLAQVGYLQSALLEQRFILYAQQIRPLQEEASGHRYEVLIRMCDRDGTLVSPAKFLTAAERYQMMSALDRWVINATLEHLGNAENTLEITLSTFCINVSAQSLADDDFASHVESRIRECGVSPDALCFEITETAVVRNLSRAQHFISRLRRLGCRFALDDFGTGYSSFAYLKSLPVQYVKLDGVFVRDLLENRLSEAIISAATQIAKVMGAATVAEHVEHELVLGKLKALGVDYAQGFIIGEPRPLTEVLTEIDRQSQLDIPALILAEQKEVRL